MSGCIVSSANHLVSDYLGRLILSGESGRSVLTLKHGASTANPPQVVQAQWDNAESDSAESYNWMGQASGLLPFAIGTVRKTELRDVNRLAVGQQFGIETTGWQ